MSLQTWWPLTQLCILNIKETWHGEYVLERLSCAVTMSKQNLLSCHNYINLFLKRQFGHKILFLQPCSTARLQSQIWHHKSSFIVNFKVYYNKPNSSTAYYRYIYTPYTQRHYTTGTYIHPIYSVYIITLLTTNSRCSKYHVCI